MVRGKEREEKEIGESFVSLALGRLMPLRVGAGHLSLCIDVNDGRAWELVRKKTRNSKSSVIALHRRLQSIVLTHSPSVPPLRRGSTPATGHILLRPLPSARIAYTAAAVASLRSLQRIM